VADILHHTDAITRATLRSFGPKLPMGDEKIVPMRKR
jgi:hypothetical protein